MTDDTNADAAIHKQFSKIADQARKVVEQHIAVLADGANAPLLDDYNLRFSILCGAAAAIVTSLVALGESVGDDRQAQAANLNALAEQMGGTLLQIQQRKDLLLGAAGATEQ